MHVYAKISIRSYTMYKSRLVWYIQRLVDHADIKCTLIYIHVSPIFLLKITNPPEKIGNIRLGNLENQNQYGFQFR